MRSAVILAAVLAVCLTAAGCASYKREVVITSNPPGAKVYVNGEEIGQTECKVILDYSKDPTARKFIQVRKNECMPAFGVWAMNEVLRKKKFTLEQLAVY